MQSVITFEALYHAYQDCRRHKRHTANAQRYELALLDNLSELLGCLQRRNYSPTQSIRFISANPKTREIYAADFSDRVVHHWLVPRLERLFEPVFIYDVYSNRKGKGTHKAVDRLQSFMRALQCHSKTQLWPGDAVLACPPKVDQAVIVKPDRRRIGWYLQLDIANFFNSIDKPILYKQLQQRLRKALLQNKITLEQARTYRWLCHVLLKHDTVKHAQYRGDTALLNRVPAHKLLSYSASTKGLPIGNLSSQFFSNVYMNPLDQYIKHQLKCQYYLRYVDDFILLADSQKTLIQWRQAIEKFLAENLQLKLKQRTHPRQIQSGADFLGYITYPHYRLVRRRVVGSLSEKLSHYQRQIIQGQCSTGYCLTLRPSTMQRLRSTLASYWGHFQHAQSYNLRKLILDRHPWLGLLFEQDALLGQGVKGKRQNARIVPCWSPPADRITGYQSQIRFFQAHFPQAKLDMQRGTCSDHFPRTVNQSGINTHSESDDRPLSSNLKYAVRHLIVQEKGYYKGGLKRRYIAKLTIQQGVALCPSA